MIDGALYFSESEHPFTVSDWGAVAPGERNDKIAAMLQADPGSLKQVDPAGFFERLGRSSDPGDEVLVQNAAKLNKLFTYLQEQLSDITVTRAEGSSRIPIVITGYLPGQSCIAIQTTAIET